MVLLLAAGLIVLTTAGQMLLKQASLNGGVWSAFFWAGNALFVVTVGISFLLMPRMELKYFSAIMSISYVTVMLASSLFFGERLSRAKILGTLLVVAGVALFTTGG